MFSDLILSNILVLFFWQVILYKLFTYFINNNKFANATSSIFLIIWMLVTMYYSYDHDRSYFYTLLMLLSSYLYFLVRGKHLVLKANEIRFIDVFIMTLFLLPVLVSIMVRNSVVYVNIPGYVLGIFIFVLAGLLIKHFNKIN